jgi:hypothetical protein
MSGSSLQQMAYIAGRQHQPQGREFTLSRGLLSREPHKCRRSIDNYAYLVKKYCLEEAGLDPKTSYLLETVRAMSTLSDAEVRLHRPMELPDVVNVCSLSEVHITSEMRFVSCLNSTQCLAKSPGYAGNSCLA